MLRKFRVGEAPTGPAWKEAAEHTSDLGEAFTINEYFVTRPEMMLGKMRYTGRMYRDNEPTLEPDARIEARKKSFCLRLNDHATSNRIQCPFLCGALPAVFR
jgi:hypothetical protein